MFSLLKRIKARFNNLLDRITELCDLVLMEVYNFPFGNILFKWLARFVGDFCVFIQGFPRLSAYYLQGKCWKFIYIGNSSFIKETLALFFPGENIQPQLISRVPVWRINHFVNQNLKESADLVILEHSRINPFLIKAPVKFTFPEWINQNLTLPQTLEGFLDGNKMKNKRKQIAKAEKYKVDWYFSQSKKDFVFFHYELYQPYISSRHKNRALLSNYDDQYERWFTRGGLVMVTDNKAPIAASLCIKTKNIVYAIELGIEEDKKNVLDYSINTFLNWAVIQWAIEQKALFLNLGGTRPYVKNGSFRSKKRWGSDVIRRSKIFQNITILGENLPQDLREQINDLGFISENNGTFQRVFIASDNSVSLICDPYL